MENVYVVSDMGHNTILACLWKGTGKHICALCLMLLALCSFHLFSIVKSVTKDTRILYHQIYAYLRNLFWKCH